MVNKIVTHLILIIIGVFGLGSLLYSTDVSAQANAGYNEGCSDARAGGHTYLNTNPGQNANFMQEYMNGYFACSSSGSSALTTSPAPTQAGINWLQLCRNPLVDTVIVEPCETLTTPNGYGLTPVGERVVACVLGGGVLLAADQSRQALAAAQALANKAGFCGSGTVTSPSGSAPGDSSNDPLGNLLGNLLGR